MRFDDRLQTMLAAPVADGRDRAVRWRQLVDLLSRSEAGPLSDAAARALEVVRRDAFAIDEEVRAATVRGIAGRRLPAALLRILAAQPVRVAAPLFAGLSLDADEASEILADADADVRALVAVAAPVAGEAPEAVATPAAPSIGEMVERIEKLNEQREAAAVPALLPRAAPVRAASRVASGRLFEWESDASGHVAWVDGAPRGALIGRPLGGDGVGLLERQAAARLAQRHPFIDEPLVIGDMFDGDWTATGVPAFDPASGRFLGYRGLARRTDGAGPIEQVNPESELHALRELVHEIRTPLNAIIGFAEIIDGQYLGPAHRNYRERAATIVGQARQLLDAVEDLDFAARLRADRAGGAGSSGRGGSVMSQLFPPIVAEIEACLGATGGLLDVDVDDQRHRCALSPELVGRLLRRLLLSLCKLVAADEVFRIALTRRGSMCLLTVARPHALAGVAEAQLVDPSFLPSLEPVPGEGENGVGLGFALRLVRGLAKVAGGGLVIDEHRITLELPALEA